MTAEELDDLRETAFSDLDGLSDAQLKQVLYRLCHDAPKAVSEAFHEEIGQEVPE